MSLSKFISGKLSDYNRYYPTPAGNLADQLQYGIEAARALGTQAVTGPLDNHIDLFCDAIRLILAEPDDGRLIIDCATAFAQSTHALLLGRMQAIKTAPMTNACNALSRRLSEINLDAVIALEVAKNSLQEGVNDVSAPPLKFDAPVNTDTQQRILEELQQGSATAETLAVRIGLSVPGIKKALEGLKESGQVGNKRGLGYFIVNH